jgi:excisionase family DNA binding protein
MDKDMKNSSACKARSPKQYKDRLCFSIPEVAKMLGISRGLAYELAGSGNIPIVRMGKRLLVPRVALERLLNQTEKDLENNRREGQTNERQAY